MPDNWVLYSPQGSALNLASILRADPGPDFGRANLPAAAFVQNPYIEGAQLAYETVGPRRMSFPLRVASGVLGMTLDTLDGALQRAARPGAWIDLQPDGVASQQAVRFDVITGRVSGDRYSVHLQRAQRREVTLDLDVMPYGYWPTWITLASVASVMLPGRVAIPAASIVGDTAGFARVIVQASTPTSYAGSWLTDMLAWGLGGYASMNAFVTPAILTAGITPASVVGDARAPASQRLDFWPSSLLGQWRTLAYYDVPTIIEPAWRGRYRAFVFARQGEPSSPPWQLLLDSVGGLQTNRAMGSAQPVATVPRDGTPGAISPSPAFNLLDLGEIILPLTASGVPQVQRLRLWTQPGTTNVGVASPLISIGGIHLLPLDGGAGILPRGLVQPTMITPSVGRLVLDSRERTGVIANVAADLNASAAPLGDAFAYYQGDLPRILPSMTSLDLIGGMRSTASGATAPLAYTARSFASVSVSYQPRFAFMSWKGV